MVVRPANSRLSWKVRTSPARARRSGPQPFMSTPSSRTDPAAKLWKPLTALMRVDFPAPFGPINPVIAPRRASKDALSTARTPPKEISTDDTERIIGPASRWGGSTPPVPGRPSRSEGPAHDPDAGADADTRERAPSASSSGAVSLPTGCVSALCRRRILPNGPYFGRWSGMTPRGRHQRNEMVSIPVTIQPRSSAPPGRLAIWGTYWAPCWRRTGTSRVPKTMPKLLPTPPTTTAVRRDIVSTYCHADGDHAPMNPTSNAPLSAAYPPPSPWTIRRRPRTFLPMARAARSSSRTARSERPSGPSVTRRRTT